MIRADATWLAIAGVMSAVQGRAVVWFGLVCSSFTVINMGHSKRSFLVPMGDTSKRTVQEGNCLGARTCLLMLLVLAMNGVFILEQPGGSFFQYFPRFQELWQTVKHYVKKGKTKYVGTKNYPAEFGARVAALLDEIHAATEFEQDFRDVWSKLEFSDLWPEANMSEVVRYLRGNRSLQTDIRMQANTSRSEVKEVRYEWVTENDLQTKLGLSKRLELRGLINDADGDAEPPVAKKSKALSKDLDPMFAETLVTPTTPTPSPATPDDPRVKALQKEHLVLQMKQAELQKKLLLLKNEKPGPAANAAPTPTPATSASEHEGSSDENGDDDDDWGLGQVLCPKTGKVLTLAAVKQRLRRMCSRRKSGKVPGGEEAFQAYKEVSGRKNLAKLLVDADFNEEKSLTVDAGWYTEQEMKDKLQYDSKTIKKIVDFTSKNPATLQRKWKYDESVVQHWVETQWSGQIVKKDKERTEHEQAAEGSELPKVDLSFESGGNDSGSGVGSSGVAGKADDPKATLERAWSEMLQQVTKIRDSASVLLGVQDATDVQKRHADALQKHADAMESHYDQMSMLKATASIRVSDKLRDEILIAVDTASVLKMPQKPAAEKPGSGNAEFLPTPGILMIESNVYDSSWIASLKSARCKDDGLRGPFAYYVYMIKSPVRRWNCNLDDERCLGPYAAPKVHWKHHKYFSAEILALPRLQTLWHLMLTQNDILKIALPDISMPKSPGAVFRCAEEMVEVVLTGVSVAYKIGFTHDPCERVQGYLQATSSTISGFARATSAACRANDAVLDGLARGDQSRLDDKSHELQLSCTEANSQEEHRTIKAKFKDFGFALDLPISNVDVGNEKSLMPMIRPTDFYRHLADLGKLSILYADQDTAVLTKFWDRFAIVEPWHTINDSFEAGLLVPERTIPLLLHGDEARSKKHLPMMVVNTHGIIGYGCRAYENWFQEAPLLRDQAGGVNLKGSVLATRYLHFVMPKRSYGPDSIFLDRMFDELAKDLARLQTEGVMVNGERWHLPVIAATGDWQFFAKVGHLTRCYTHVAKRSGQRTLNGICHLCMAGTANLGWEDFVDDPDWMQSIGAEEPWVETPKLIRRLHTDAVNKAKFFRPDFWHCLHLGSGKAFVASAVAEWLRVTPGNNITERLEYVDRAAQSWLQGRNDKLYCRRISEVTMGIDSLQKVPTGGWQKASDTTLLLEFVEHFCSIHSEHTNQDAILRWIWVAAANINLSIRTLYQGGLWLDQHHGRTAAVCGLNFLKAYGHLVSLCLRADRDRFPVTPKLHMLHHLFLELKTDSSRHSWALNMLGTSVQQDETFVGILGRHSRRVGPVHTALRTLQRYLCHAAEHLTPEYRRV
ncbi:unnamed protein product [Symbiodinium sp. CCMP2456]|nr:unnamed protein product [Symbiodinium sp. CCMP2456]